MQIDVTERVETAKRLTREWAGRAGYKQPPKDEGEHSKKARDLARILGVSSFGCQQRNVQSILECLIGESIPYRGERQLAEYTSRERFVIGSVLVPVREQGGGVIRAGLVVRLSQASNAGLRMSNGMMQNTHFDQGDVRPATDEEIDTYFAEFFGVAVHPADVPQVAGEAVEDDDLGVPF